MSHMLRPFRVLPAALVAVLAIPAAAQAATYTVSPGQKVADAAAAAKAGDTILIKAGVYPESVTIAADGVTVRGEVGAALTGAPGSTAPTLNFTAQSGAADVVTTLIVGSTGGGPAIAAATAPLSIADVIAVSNQGAALSIAPPSLPQPGAAAARAYTVQRALLVGATDAVSFAASDTAAKSLTIDSVVLLGAQSGIRANTGGGSGSALNKPGALTLAARHVTIVGPKTPLALSATATDPTGAGGNITATVADSIVLSSTTATARAVRQCLPGTPLCSPVPCRAAAARRRRARSSPTSPARSPVSPATAARPRAPPATTARSPPPWRAR